MLAFVDDFLNRITMYRLVLYYLLVVLAAAGVLGLVGLVPVNVANLAFSTLLILAICWVANIAFARIFGAATNVESFFITALILALIISPVAPGDLVGVGFLIFASAWAMASKYIFAYGKKHVFNPAAFAVALSAFAIGQSATWWVGGNLYLLPFVFVGGLLVVRKLRRFDLVVAFVVVALLTSILTSGASDTLTPLSQTLLHSSLFFLGFVMLTEPLTMPVSQWGRIAYGALVGFLFAPNIHIGSFYLTPEIALLVGNLFAYVVNPKGRFMLALADRAQLGTDTYEFAFTSDRPLHFRPGQYLEWTLPHSEPDHRGNRRFFTIASAPSETRVNLGVKFYENASSFKRALAQMKRGDLISASTLSGDFVLPTDRKKKLVFIAGGIGVTPFRSMIQHMLDTRDARDAVLFYANKTAEEISYKNVFDRAAQELGLKTFYVTGILDAALIAREVPDYRERTFYISGPHGMVTAFQKTLRAMGVPFWHIKTDYFPGFA